MSTDLHLAWRMLDAATPPGWLVGQPYFHDELDAWEQHAYNATETPVDGKRGREWTAVSPTEGGAVSELARCLGELRAGRWPR